MNFKIKEDILTVVILCIKVNDTFFKILKHYTD